MLDAAQHPYLENERGIPAELLASERFIGRIKIDPRGNAAFPHIDADGLTGYELKNRNFTGFASGGTNVVAVTVGPGSFTGLRVGLAFAKGLALALELPCVGVGTLAALAASVPGSGGRGAVIDNGRGQVWLQRFEGETALGPPETVATEALADAGLLVGPTATRLAAPGQAAIDLAWPTPLAVARRAATHPEPARPLYLRAPDARPKSA